MENRIRTNHSLCLIKLAANAILGDLSPFFVAAYAKRSGRQLAERLDTDLLFRWFCGIDPASAIFNATVFAHNRPRLDAFGITTAFFDASFSARFRRA